MIGIINTKNNDAKSIKIEIRINTHSRMISTHNALIQISFLGRISLELAVIVFKRKSPHQIQVYATNGRAGRSDKLLFRSVFNVVNT